ncbi:MAG TPA: NADH-quinone oxidoreductase subunit J, partial [Aggregatilineales bacterium]|nr:NADH-quinone oxidoreductase subunit J [Aggregatilineales bacterium]
GVVVSRNLLHAALYLILALFGIAGLFITLEAPFLAVVQILVYVGAISILITITIMVTRRVMGVTESVNRQWPIAALGALLLFGILGFTIVSLFGGQTVAQDVPPDMIERLGQAFASPYGYLLPFEVASILLLAAMIGAIVVARE